MEVYAVILVGGKGKRLRPLSTSSRPKPFLSITCDNRTLFKRTVERIRNIVPADHVVIVANKAHKGLIKKEVPGLHKDNLILEPVSRNTAPAVALAAKILGSRLEDAVMVVLPADHYIKDEKKHLDSLKKGIEFVKDHKEALVALAVKPRFPATGFGYVKAQSSKVKGQRQKVYKVERFVEKPDIKTANRYVKDKRYLWNTGAFIFTANTILRNIKKYVPEIIKGLKAPGRITAAYKNIPDISLDYAVMERSPDIYTVLGSYDWHDVGTFDCLKKILRKESRGFIERGSKVIKII